jgi:hypothetical protein
VELSYTRDGQYLSLRTAAALAYMSLVGKPPDAYDSVNMQRVLNDLAHALSVVAPIRTYDEAPQGAAPHELKPSDLIDGRFARGGSALVQPDGSEVKQLVIQRRDLDSAILMLKETTLAKSLRDKHAAV